MERFFALPHSLQAAAVLTAFALVVMLGATRLSVAALSRLAPAAPVLAALPAALDWNAGSFPVVLVAGALLMCALLLHVDDFENPRHRAECTALQMFGAAGAGVLATAPDLLSLLIGFETMSLSVAVLAGLGRGTKSLEVAFKFFVLAAVAAATLVYGIALRAWTTGSFAFDVTAVAAAAPNLQFVGSLLVVLGVGFELAIVPMHFATLGICFAAPVSCMTFAMTVSKVAAALALARLVATEERVAPVLAVLGVITIVWATLAGLAQRNLRGLLAYSAVAQGGFLALAVACGPSAHGSLAFYAIVYVASVGLVAGALCGNGIDLVGTATGRLGRLRGIALVVGLVSLAGVPPAPGFWGKLAVLVASWHGAGALITIVATVGAVFGALFYLRPVPDLIARMPSGDARTAPTIGARIVIGIAAAVVLCCAVVPYLVKCAS